MVKKKIPGTTEIRREMFKIRGIQAFLDNKDVDVEAAKIEDPTYRSDFRLGYLEGKEAKPVEPNKISLPLEYLEGKETKETKPVGPSKISFPFGDEAAPASNGALKFDDGKAPVLQGCVQRFPLALQQVSLVSAYGKTKYGTFDGWESLEDAYNRYRDALGRHMLLMASEGPYDAGDSGLPHLAQVAWNALATLELALRNGDIEMTVGNKIENGKPILGSNGRSNDVIK